MYDLLSKTCQNADFLRPVISRIWAESSIFSLYRKIRVTDNAFFGIFYAVVNACAPFQYSKLCGLNANDAKVVLIVIACSSERD